MEKNNQHRLLITYKVLEVSLLGGFCVFQVLFLYLINICFAIFFLFLKPKSKPDAMRKLASLVWLAALLLGFTACGDKHSKAFHVIEKEIKDIEHSIQQTNDCAELDMFSFSILGVKSDVENLLGDETLKAGEIESLNEAVEQIEAIWNGKKASLNCPEPTEDDIELDLTGEGEDLDDLDVL